VVISQLRLCLDLHYSTSQLYSKGIITQTPQITMGIFPVIFGRLSVEPFSVWCNILLKKCLLKF